MTLLAIVADDLTGAADTGASFAGAGFSTTIHLRGAAPNAEIVVCSTESRHLPAVKATAAAERSTRALLEASGGRPRWMYKKIDSVLRGTPGGEALAMLRETGAKRMLVAPALPAENRVTIGGQQLFHRVPVDRAGFDVPTADLAHLFQSGDGCRMLPLNLVRNGPQAVAAALRSAGERIVIADAETDHDLEVLADAAIFAEIDCFAGSAGLAAALASRMQSPLTREMAYRPKCSGGVLVLAGSRHEATAAQVRRAEEMGVARVEMTSQEVIARNPEDAIERANATLKSGSSVMVTPPVSRVDRSADLLASFAEAGERIARATSLGGIVLTGGDVAAAVCERLSVESIVLGGEALPAIPWGEIKGGPYTGLAIVTKAGSFGGANAIARLIQFLGGEPTIDRGA